MPSGILFQRAFVHSPGGGGGDKLKHIGNTKFVNIGLSSKDVIPLDHLDAPCKIDHSDWLVHKTTKVRCDMLIYILVQLICSF